MKENTDKKQCHKDTHDWGYSYNIGVLGTLVSIFECENCGLRMNNPDSTIIKEKKKNV